MKIILNNKAVFLMLRRKQSWIWDSIKHPLSNLLDSMMHFLLSKIEEVVLEFQPLGEFLTQKLPAIRNYVLADSEQQTPQLVMSISLGQ